MPSADAHTRKRPYQPPITSFLSRHGSIPSTLPSFHNPLSPPLPAETQANLLSVGMRVRKSVPEGYKTHKTLASDTFPFPSTAPPTAPHVHTRERHGNGSGDMVAGGASRELTPLCGLHKTGGWAQQEPWAAYLLPASSAPAAFGRDDGMDEDGQGMPGLSWSQSTLSSTQDSLHSGSFASGVGGSKKRSFEEEMEDDMDTFFDEVEGREEGVLPSTRRVIAQPKRSLRKAATVAGIVGESGEDFDEAAFLAPMDVDGV